MISKEIKQFLKEKKLKDNGLYFISFIEEGIMNEDYQGYVGGRIEIWADSYEYDIEEIRFLTTDKEGYRNFREKYDFKDVDTKTLDLIERITKEKYYQDIDYNLTA